MVFFFWRTEEIASVWVNIICQHWDGGVLKVFKIINKHISIKTEKPESYKYDQNYKAYKFEQNV